MGVWSADLTAPCRLGAAGQLLWRARTEIGRLLYESEGPDLGNDVAGPPLLAATARYSGLIYRAANIAGWDEAIFRRFSEEALIVSGLYGLVAPQEPIRFYNCGMKDRLSTGETVGTWWRRRGLGRWLREYLEERGITDVYSFLSATYERSLGGLTFGGQVRVHRIDGGPGFDGLRVQGRLLVHLVNTGGGAAVQPARGGRRMQSESSRSRAEVIGQVLGSIPESVYERIDFGEPESPVLKHLCSLAPPYGILTGLALALSDYQLGLGGAPQYWKDVKSELEARGPISSLPELRSFMGDVMHHPSAARLAQVKLRRVDRLLASTLPGWLGMRSIQDVGRDPMALWHGLAIAMGQPLDAKTVAFAMKVFDLLHSLAVGRYVDFPHRVPIVVDLRIARVSLSSGLMGPFYVDALLELMANVEAYIAEARDQILTAWATVSQHAGDISLFRIDSLIWQVAPGVYQHRRDRTMALGSVARVLEDYGAEPGLASRIGIELTQVLPLRVD